MSQPIFYVGQQVGCLMYGEGVVTAIESDFDYPIRVKIKDAQAPYMSYTSDGKYESQARPTLYSIEQYRAIIANLPAPEPEKWQPKMGEWCWFWLREDDADDFLLSKFTGMVRGKDFLSRTGIPWENCAPFKGELPPHLKEVQP